MRNLLLAAALLAAPAALADAKVSADIDVEGTAALGLGAGVDSWFDHGMVTSGYLYGWLPAGRDGVRAGLRSGVAVNHNASLLAIPFDGVVRFDLRGGYIDAVMGPHWLTRARDFRMHAALGMGAKFDMLSLGVEVGYLNPSPILGGRVALAF